MSTVYQKENDDFFHGFYQVSWVMVSFMGLLGIVLLFFTSSINVSIGFLGTIVNNIMEILTIVAVLSASALVVGWLQVALASKLGEELVLLVTWLTPFIVIGTSLYIYNDTKDPNYLGGAVAGSIFLLLVFYFRHSFRLSARLIEVGAEVTASHPALFIPQLVAVIATLLLTILMVPGVVTVATLAARIHVVLSIFAVALYLFMYSFVIACFQAFADASNISYINDWYIANHKPSLSDASTHTKDLKAPIVRYAFLMAFISRFKSKRNNRYSIGNLFNFMKFSNWTRALTRGRSMTSTAADALAYFGSYTLVVIIVDNMDSVAAAYEHSMRSVFSRFVENIAGSLGFNILESVRVVVSALLMLAAGALFGYINYDHSFVLAVIFGFLFLIIGYYPLNAMFKPAVNAYRVVLYSAHKGIISDQLDDKTVELIDNVMD